MILIKINHHYLKVEHHSNSTRWSPIQSNIKYYTHVGVIFDLGGGGGGSDSYRRKWNPSRHTLSTAERHYYHSSTKTSDLVSRRMWYIRSHV
jgi:hypothetical protein